VVCVYVCVFYVKSVCVRFNRKQQKEAEGSLSGRFILPYYFYSIASPNYCEMPKKYVIYLRVFKLCEAFQINTTFARIGKIWGTPACSALCLNLHPRGNSQSSGQPRLKLQNDLIE